MNKKHDVKLKPETRKNLIKTTSTSQKQKSSKRKNDAAIQFEWLFNFIDTALLFEDSNGKIVFANNKFYTLFGLRNKNKGVIGSTLTEFSYKLIEKFSLPSEFFNKKLSLPGKSFELSINNIVVTQYCSKINSSPTPGFLWQFSKTSLNPNNSFTDEKNALVNELKESESRFYNLANSTSTLIWISETNKGVVYLNEAFLKFRGRTFQDESGFGWESGIHPDDILRAREIFGENRKNKTAYSIEYRFLRYDGKYRWILESGTPRFSSDGQLKGFIGTAIDITERKVSELDLKRLKSAVEILQDSLIIADINGTILYSNPATAKMRHQDLKAEELIGINYFDLFESKHLPKIKTDLKEVLKNGLIKNREYEIPNHSGRDHILQMSSSLINDENKNPIGFVTIARDITDKKLDEIELRRLLTAVQASPESIVVTDLQSNMLFVNDATLKMVGENTTREELLGKSAFDLLRTEDRSRALNDIKEVFSNGIIEFKEYAVANRDSQLVVVEMTIVLIRNSKNEPIGFVTISRDITEKKNSEALILAERELFYSGPVIVFKVGSSPGWPIEYVSSSIKSLMGYEPEGLIGSSKLIEFIHPDDKERIIKETDDLDRSGSKSFKREYRFVTSYGDYKWFEDHTVIIKDEYNRISNYYGYLLDITERKHDQEILKKSEQDMRALNSMKDKFFSIIAHDLRSPFQGLIGIASIMLEDEELTHEERMQFTQKLMDGLKNEFSLLEDLLTWSRLQRGAIYFLPKLNFIKEDILNAVYSQINVIESKKLNIETDVDVELSAYYDKNMISAVLRNLISNAVKFTKEYGKIIISGTLQPESVLITIRDTGIGIAQENIKKLFRIDTHFSTKGTNSESGSGLGLILCKDFIEKHNCEIWVESVIGKGSAFNFTLPINKI